MDGIFYNRIFTETFKELQEKAKFIQQKELAQ